MQQPFTTNCSHTKFLTDPTSNQIDLAPKTKIDSSAIDTLEHTRSQIYSAGPSLNLLTSYGLLSLRYYE